MGSSPTWELGNFSEYINCSKNIDIIFIFIIIIIINMIIFFIIIIIIIIIILILILIIFYSCYYYYYYGGLSKETSIAYKRMAELLAIKRKTEYSTTLAWMRCSLSFALIRSAVACIRGTRVSLFRHASETNIELGYGESRLFSI